MKIGTLEINDRVFISDPCYDKGTWCTTLTDIDFGKYNCFVDRTKDGIIKELYIIKDGYKISDCYFITGENAELGNCGVDSGQLGIFNYDKFKGHIDKKEFNKSLKNDFPYEDWKRMYDEKDNDVDTFYKCCCNHTLNKKRVGIIKGMGIVSSSGYGDGCYPVYPIKIYKFTHYETVGLHIPFVFD